MPLFKGQKGDFALYIHIPKTGGTTIQQLISENNCFIGSGITRGNLPTTPQHFHRELLEQVGYSEIALSSFAIVREPLERIISEFKYRKRSSIIVRLFMDFDSFVCFNFLQFGSNSFVLDNHIRPQNEFILDDTAIFRIEDGLTSVFKMLFEGYGIGLRETQLHANKSKNEKIIMSSSTFNNVINFYKKDYEFLGYELPEPINISKIKGTKYFYTYFKSYILHMLYTAYRKLTK